MSGEEQTGAGTDVVVREQARELALMSDDEIRRTYRIAEALFASGAFKEVKKAEQAFAKIIIGRDLGLTPAQSMAGIHLVDGGVSMHYATLGQFVRSREGYDYRAGWLKQDGRNDPDGDPDRELPVVAVWHDEEEADDLRPIIGAAVEFIVDGERRGVSRFTEDDARQANLIKENLDRRAAWSTSRRNMLLARAMSNGVKWFVPEVLGGMPVYAPGELPEQKPELTEGTGDGEPKGIELGPEVEKIIATAERLGHRGLSNRAQIELAVGDRAPGAVRDWVKRAKDELVRFEREKAGAPQAGDEVVAETPDEVVVQPAEVEVEAPPEEVTAEPVIPTPRPSTTTPDPDQVLDEEAQALFHRYERLAAIDRTSMAADDVEQLDDEMERVESQLRAKGVAVTTTEEEQS